MLRLILNSLAFISGALSFALASFVVTRNLRARANRLLAFGFLILGTYQGALGLASFSEDNPWRPVFMQVALVSAAALAPVFFAFSLSFGERNGGSRSIHWRPALYGLCAAVPLAWVALATGHLVLFTPVSPAAPNWVRVDSWGKGFLAVLVVGVTLVLLQMENLFRHADTNTRWRIKFFVVGMFVTFAPQIILASYALLYGVIHPSHASLSAVALLFGLTSVAFALVRHRLLQVDIFVSRYIVYRSLTLALVGGYLIALGGVAEISQWLNLRLDLVTGILLGSVGAAGLALVLLSHDVRRRVQSFVHRHFYKHKYDYRIEWMEFTRRLSQVTTVPDIAAQTVHRILEVMWVQQAAMYSATPTTGHLALVNQVGYEGLPASIELSGSTVQRFLDEPKSRPGALPHTSAPPVPPDMAQALNACSVGIVVPVVALNTLAGLLVVGPEASGEPFGVDDRDLLAAVAAQAGAMIVNSRLAQEAADGREVQALARLSAFVAHDLKNSVGMLSLLAENAPGHIHKPEFQADVIRTLGQVTERMQRILSALHPSNQEPVRRTTQGSLAQAIDALLSELKPQIPPRITLETRLAPTPDVAMDPEQLRTVLANLVLNAVEAISNEGRITVETGTDDGRAILVVTDTGRGMSADFIRDRLFRPFQTTKSKGLGIGLYQCRHIIHGLGGDLSAESREGVGTRMTVRLPVVKDSEQLAAGSETGLGARR